MNVLAIQSSGDETSVCVIHNENVISYSLRHERKDRPETSSVYVRNSASRRRILIKTARCSVTAWDEKALS